MEVSESYNVEYKIIYIYCADTSGNGWYAGQRRFPLADQMSDDEGSPAASATHLGGEVELTKAQNTQQLVNCLLVWRFELKEAEDKPLVEDSDMANSEQQE